MTCICFTHTVGIIDRTTKSSNKEIFGADQVDITSLQGFDQVRCLAL